MSGRMRFALLLLLVAGKLGGCAIVSRARPVEPSPGAVCRIDGIGPVRVVRQLPESVARPGWWVVDSTSGRDWWIASADSLRGCQ